MSVVASGRYAYERDPDAITARSFAIIRAEADLSRFGSGVGIAERIAHAAGDVAVLADLVMRGDLTAATRAALEGGCPVVVDTEMTRHAIAARAVSPDRVVCRLNEPGTAAAAAEGGTTRAATGIRRAAADIAGAVVVIGNAPTALFALLELLRDGVRPAALYAFPVGFVGAVESKAALVALAPSFPHATLTGRRGGSAIAGAALNGAVLAADASAATS
ncbi:precorrin-8X methylmutase [Acuticoccus sp.]|uniref:precorrin-8X methylmutase n=1 Tax=Acuticoccus sp. TaxID=1904378 RepID=UPI003B52C679